MAEAAELLQQIENKLAVLVSIESRLASIEKRLEDPADVMLCEVKISLDALQQGIGQLLPPLQEMEISKVARGGPEALAEWNRKKKAQRRQKEINEFRG